MKYLLLTILLFPTLLAAQDPPPDDTDANVSGIYYDPVRAGEGLFVTHNRLYGVVGLGLFTFDPAHTVEEESCETVDAVYLDDLLVQGSYEHCVSLSAEVGNQPSWYIAADTWDGSSYGVLYRSEAYDYPTSYANKIAEETAVGFYILDKVDDGMRLIVTPFEGEAPETLFRLYFFTVKIMESN
jgi:hypothetical protein